jgi:hypothetical protein
MEWTARRILKELADSDRRRRVLTAFWKHSEQQARLAATARLAKALRFRDESIRKMPPEKKADLLASRIGSPEFDEAFGVALMLYHTHEQNGMMAAFLDHWNVPHENGSIEADDFTPPTADQVRDAVRVLEATYDKRDIALYLASAGLLMGGKWEEATWPVVEEMAR